MPVLHTKVGHDTHAEGPLPVVAGLTKSHSRKLCFVPIRPPRIRVKRTRPDYGGRLRTTRGWRPPSFSAYHLFFNVGVCKIFS